MTRKPTYEELEQKILELEKEASEFKRAEEALRESEVRYRNLFDIVNDFIYTHDLEGRFLTLNRGAAQTLGYAPEDLIGRPVTDFMLPEFHQAFYEEYLPQIKKQGSQNGVTEYVAKDDTKHYIEYRNVLVRQKGLELCVSGTGRDITDRILGQREVHKLEQQLQQAQKMEAIGTLAGGIAHDFNNLLMGILGNTSLMLLEMDGNNPQYERLKTVEEHVRLGADLTKQLVGFARGGKYEAKPTDINELITKSSEMLGRGTGLGLASVYGVIKNHGGYINVYSEKNEGTTFTIYLPASEKDVPGEMKLPEKVVPGTAALLLVDDEDIIIEVGEQMLKTLGYEVLLARGGKKAIEIYTNNKDKVDMVLLDMIMPDLGGGETYDRLKEINPDVKVLLSSGYSINEKANEILERGCNGFIQKPFDLRELSEKIGEILCKE